MGFFHFLKKIKKKFLVSKKFRKYSSFTLQDILQKTLEHHQQNQDKLKVKIKGKSVILSGHVKSYATLEKAFNIIEKIPNLHFIEANNVIIDHKGGNSKAVEFYQVKEGDTFLKISKKIYGSGDKNEEILKANKPIISNPDKIYPGQILRIPN